jgi:hypothetical protein
MAVIGGIFDIRNDYGPRFEIENLPSHHRNIFKIQLTVLPPFRLGPQVTLLRGSYARFLKV